MVLRTNRKKNISKKLREEVWLKHFGEIFSSKCPIRWCTRQISVFSFETGHNIPESKGGRTAIDNLIPICADCNRSMGDRFTIDEFSRQFAAEEVAINIPGLPIATQQSWFQRFCSCLYWRKPIDAKTKTKTKFIKRGRSSVRTIFK
jgi:HNH endonuclease